MKKLILIMAIFSNDLLSSPIEVKKSTLKSSNVAKTTSSTSTKKTLKKDSRVNKVVAQGDIVNTFSEELNEVKKIDSKTNLEIKKFLNKNTISVWDFSNRFDVKTGTAIKGIILNSIVSSNLDSPILVETQESVAGIPEGVKFSCVGITKNKRVLSVCNKLITESDEYEVDILLLNSDGTAGLLGRAYSGKEQYAVGAITAAALKGALDVSLDRINTPLGTESVSITGKNKIKSGGIGALDEIIQMSADEYKTQEPKISIDAGKEVLIYFNRRFKI